MAVITANGVPGSRAVLRFSRMSAFKARQVLDLIRGQDADRALEILLHCDRAAARVVYKVLASALANAENNDGRVKDDLYVAACYADEAATLKRWRPRARGRATRIRKRSCHITIVVARMPDERLRRSQAARAERASTHRSRRVAGARRAAAMAASTAGLASQTSTGLAKIAEPGATPSVLDDGSPDGEGIAEPEGAEREGLSAASGNAEAEDDGEERVEVQVKDNPSDSKDL